MTAEQLADLLRSHGNRIFRVTFIKRTNGTVRNMVCRFGVKPAKPAGRDRLSEDSRCDCVTVYEMGVGYKRIPLEGILEVTP